MRRCVPRFEAVIARRGLAPTAGRHGPVGKQVVTCYRGVVESTRDLLLTEGMRLFGEQGYAATSVAQIEAAAGLSPGSGSLYKHFHSKQALLTAGLDRLLSGGRGLTEQLQTAGSEDGSVALLTAVARAGLARMDEDRDLNRVLFRGLEGFPDLLARVGEDEIGRFHQATTAMLADLAGAGDGSFDGAAVAVVLQGATAHYWLLRDLFGRHPTGVDEDRFVAAAAALTAALLDTTREQES